MAWRSRPLAGRLVALTAGAIPLVASALAALTVLKVVDRDGPAKTIAVWVIAFGAAALTFHVCERLCRRLIPLSLLLKLSLVFPDHAPSRMGVALRAGSPKRLLREDVSQAERPHDAAMRVLALAANLAAHDRTTRGHCERVRAYSELLAVELGLAARDHDRLRWAALLHDVGKLAVPPEVLNSTGKLSDQDWETIRRHPEEGARLMEPLVPWLEGWATAVAQHHERYDGTGYPHGLSGEQLTLAARVVAVADSYDAMTAERSYSKPMAAGAARAELAKKAGTQFDPAVVRAFLNISIGRIRWIIGPAALFALLPGLGIVQRLGEKGRQAGSVVAAGALAAAVAVGGGQRGDLKQPATPHEVALAAQGGSAVAAPTLDAEPGTAAARASALAASSECCSLEKLGLRTSTNEPRPASDPPKARQPESPSRPPQAPPLCQVSVQDQVCAGVAVASTPVPEGVPAATAHVYVKDMADVTVGTTTASVNQRRGAGM